MQHLAQVLLGKFAGERREHASVDGASVQLGKRDRAPVQVKRPRLERYDFADKVVGVFVSVRGMRHCKDWRSAAAKSKVSWGVRVERFWIGFENGGCIGSALRQGGEERGAGGGGEGVMGGGGPGGR